MSFVVGTDHDAVRMPDGGELRTCRRVQPVHRPRAASCHFASTCAIHAGVSPAGLTLTTTMTGRVAGVRRRMIEAELASLDRADRRALRVEEDQQDGTSAQPASDTSLPS